MSVFAIRFDNHDFFPPLPSRTARDASRLGVSPPIQLCIPVRSRGGCLANAKFRFFREQKIPDISRTIVFWYRLLGEGKIPVISRTKSS